MRTTILLIALTLLHWFALAAEMTAGEPKSREQVVVIAPRDTSEARRGVQCLEHAIKEMYPHVSLMPPSVFRKLTFPWFETGVAPQDDRQMAEALKRRRVMHRLGELGVRHLVVTDLTTAAPELGGPFNCAAGMGVVGCFGVAVAERQSRITAQVWDVTTGDAVKAPHSAESKGTSWAAGFLIPVWRTAPTEEYACANMAKQLGPILMQ